MFSIGVPPDTRLRFTTVVVARHSFEHKHRDRSGFTWKEPMTLDIHVLAFRLDAIRRASNDNNRRLVGEGSVSPKPTIP